MRTYELYSGYGGGMRHLETITATNWQQARAYFAKAGYYGICTMIEISYIQDITRTRRRKKEYTVNFK